MQLQYIPNILLEIDLRYTRKLNTKIKLQIITDFQVEPLKNNIDTGNVVIYHMTVKSIHEQKMEEAIKELKKEVKGYNRNNTFEQTFAKYFKKAQIRSMKEVIREAKKRLKETKKRLKSE